ncbi:hypothetical protein BBJ28_00009060 [Nothophytophthora sp. Chile5]|nr:hypothetical protein BBJ28_00009060 [Nothophytophthora sp. Chile5]
MVQVFTYFCAIVAAATAHLTAAWPTSTGTVEYSEVYVVAAGETFDGGLKTYSRSDITCAEQAEGGWKDAVFSLEAGATLKNVIIGNSLVTVNSNNGDVATFTDDIHVHSDDGNDDIVICKTTAATDGDEPETTSTGVSENCVYDADAIEYY